MSVSPKHIFYWFWIGFACFTVIVYHHHLIEQDR